MKVFFGWSRSSHDYALAMKEYLLACFGGRIGVFISDDIPNGVRWTPELEAELKSSDFGVFSLTDDSVPDWICYEAGVLSALGKPTALLLFGARTDQLFSSLSSIQAKKYSRKSTSDLAEQIYDGGAKDDVRWDDFKAAREDALDKLDKKVVQINDALVDARRYTLDAFARDLNEMLEISGGDKMQEWLCQAGNVVENSLRQKIPVKSKWENIEQFRQKLTENGGSSPVCRRILQRLDELIDA